MLKFAILKTMKNKTGMDLSEILLEYDQDVVFSKILTFVKATLPKKSPVQVGVFRNKTLDLGWNETEIETAFKEAFDSVTKELKDQTIRLR